MASITYNPNASPNRAGTLKTEIVLKRKSYRRDRDSGKIRRPEASLRLVAATAVVRHTFHPWGRSFRRFLTSAGPPCALSEVQCKHLPADRGPCPRTFAQNTRLSECPSPNGRDHQTRPD